MASICRRAMTRPILVLVLAALVAIPQGSLAEPAIPADLQAAIITRVLAYDRSLRRRTGASIVIGVVAKAADRASTQTQADIAKALSKLQTSAAQGLPLKIVSHAYKNQADLSEWITGENVHVLYVSSGLGEELNSIAGVCTEKEVTSVSAVRTFVERGLAIGIVIREDRPAILVNLAAAKSSGMDIDPKLLQLSEIIR